MFFINKMFKLPVKKKKRSLLSAFLCLVVVYGGFQVIYFREDYSPLQLLSSVENEANRLLRFMTQVHIHCNNSLATNNVSHWLLCNEPSLGMAPDVSSTKGIVYSVGPSADFGFEHMIDKNSSYQQFIFSPTAKHPQFTNNRTMFYKLSIVPNDPADYGRNSYQTQTLNSIRENLKHRKIDILKIENLIDSFEAHELIHFLVKDSFLNKVKELHFVLQPDKVDEDYIYSWYRVLYSLFHKAGFRLYHTAASNSLCLQDTIMESCKYYLSWLRSLPPQVFVLYPPAIDGSLGFEEDRLTDFLEESSNRATKLISVTLKLNSSLGLSSKNLHAGSDGVGQVITKMSEKVLTKNAPPCTILFMLDVGYRHFKYESVRKNSPCSILCIIPLYDNQYNSFQFINITSSTSRTGKTSPPTLSIVDIQDLLKKSSTSILYMDGGEKAWELISFILSTEIPKVLDEIIMKADVFHASNIIQPIALRRKYSILKQLEAFDMALVDYESHEKSTLRFKNQYEWMTFNFVKRTYV